MHRACAKCGTYNGRQVQGGMEAVEKTLAKETKVAKVAEAAKEAPVKKPRAAAKKKVVKTEDAPKAE